MGKQICRFDLKHSFLQNFFSNLKKKCFKKSVDKLYSTVQYRTEHYGSVQYSTVQYSIIQFSTVQYSTV